MVTGSFDHLITKPHDGKAASQVVDEGVEALHGVSAEDKVHLQQAFGISTIADLAANRFFRAATSIAEEAADIGHDRGPDVAWSQLFAEAPLAAYQAHPNDFRLDFGPVYYRGRLDGTARVLIVGQDPAANELVGHRIFVGASGQRVQGFLRRIGIRRDYLMVNTFLYPVFGQFFGSLADLTKDADILGFRNRMLDKIRAENPLEAVITIGNAAKDAVERWQGVALMPRQHLTHPSALDHGALLANWNAGLATLRAIVEPEADAPPDRAMYGQDWADVDHEPVPRRDLPFGVPDWHGVGSRARRGRNSDNSTDPKAIVWSAP